MVATVISYVKQQLIEKKKLVVVNIANLIHKILDFHDVLNIQRINSLTSKVI